MKEPARHTYGINVSVAEVAAVCLKESFAELFRCWEAAAGRSQEDPEHVHQLRVASRRVTAVLRLFADHLPRRRTKKMLRLVGALRKSAGPARDADVFAALLASGMPTPNGAEAELRQRAASQFAELLQEQRAAAQRELLAFYEQYERGEKLERAVTELLGSLQPRGKRAARESSSFPRWAARQLRLATRDFFAEANVDTERLRQLHRFRIRAKQLRYRLEWLQPAFASDRFEQPSASLKKLCQRLGKINDHVIAVATISRWLTAAFDPASAHILRHWRTAEKRDLRKELSSFDDWWSGRRRRRFRRRLDEAARSARTVRQPR